MRILETFKKAFGKGEPPNPEAFAMPFLQQVPQYNINEYSPQTGRIIGEDGNTYNLVDLLMGASLGSSNTGGGNHYIWRPSVTAEGILTWNLSISQAPPIPQDIRGQPGINGETPQFRMNPDEPTVLQYRFPSTQNWGDLFTFPNQGSGAGSSGDIDYEEGTWTPRLHGSVVAGEMQYTHQSGFFVRIGNMVWIQCRINLSSRDPTATGSARIDGLPFRVRNLANTQASHAVQINRTPWEPGQIPYIHLPTNASRVDINLMRPNTTIAEIPITSIGNNTHITFSANYIR